MNDKKQTAVEWLLEQWPILESQLPSSIIDEALQMEKEQHEITYNQGLMSNFQTFNDYYNDTYGDHSVDDNKMIDHIADVRKMVGGQDEK